jgi:hypothetical protein
MTVNDVKRVYENSGRHLSMDALLLKEKILTYMTFYCVQVNPNPDRELIHERHVLKLSVLETLTPREADVFVCTLVLVINTQ